MRNIEKFLVKHGYSFRAAYVGNQWYVTLYDNDARHIKAARARTIVTALQRAVNAVR